MCMRVNRETFSARLDVPEESVAAGHPRRPSRRERRALSRVFNHHDARAQARRVLPRGIADYVDGGAEDEVTLDRNVRQFERFALRPRMGKWVAEPELETTLFGCRLSMPVLTAPCGGMRLVHPDGDLAVARAAAAVGTRHIASAAGGYPLEEIAACGGEPWFQLYRFFDSRIMEKLVERAATAGYRVLVVTVDTPVGGRRERDYRNGFSLATAVDLRTALRAAPQLAPHPRWTYRFWRDGMPFDIPNTRGVLDDKALALTELSRSGSAAHCPSWEEIAWIRDQWDGPLVIKGLLTAEDARRAVDTGADGIVVSNHGGRQLDSGLTTTQALPEIRSAVGDSIEVILDSGIRRGSDVIKSLALGAKAVLVGRLPVWGLAIAGQAGVEHGLNLLQSEITRTMRLLGCASVRDLDPSWLHTLHGGAGDDRW
jgi:L-lactate dehydrogenase (cytochrome)